MTLQKNFKKIAYISHFPMICIIDQFFFCFDSVEEKCFYHESRFYGVNFPADGPVMKKMTTNWEPSCEKIIPVPTQGILKGDVSEYLLLKDGGRYHCKFASVYKYVVSFLDK